MMKLLAEFEVLLVDELLWERVWKGSPETLQMEPSVHRGSRRAPVALVDLPVTSPVAAGVGQRN